MERGLPAAVSGVQDVRWIDRDSFSALLLVRLHLSHPVAKDPDEKQDHLEVYQVSSDAAHDGGQLQYVN